MLWTNSVRCTLNAEVFDTCSPRIVQSPAYTVLLFQVPANSFGGSGSCCSQTEPGGESIVAKGLNSI